MAEGEARSRKGGAVQASPPPIQKDFPGQAAIETEPPGRFAPTGMQAGPLCFRPLNQNAVSHTFAPGTTVLGNTTSTDVQASVPFKLPRPGCPPGESLRQS